jgi:NAD(P)-dependent dehydrogenase (short-subunit alcohol dehydrogenase family)
MNLQLKGQHALVTGSTAGIGYAIAHTLAAEGATVTLNGRSEQNVGRALEQVLAGAAGDRGDRGHARRADRHRAWRP